ncbi:MAG: RluA family pseudouridine synthase [Limisphaerales bacterium]
MPRNPEIRLPGLRIPILFEDRAILAIDKPVGWQLAPEFARRISQNLHALLMGSVVAGDQWARSRNIRFVRYVHRLDAPTSGVLLLARNKGAVAPLSQCFSHGATRKIYLAAVKGKPERETWTSRLALLPLDKKSGKVRPHKRDGKAAETQFQLIAHENGQSLIACEPVSGRTHQIRVHLAEAGYPILGDPLYHRNKHIQHDDLLGLRAVSLSLTHPFTKKRIQIDAPWDRFAKTFGFDPQVIDFEPHKMTGSAPNLNRVYGKTWARKTKTKSSAKKTTRKSARKTSGRRTEK